MTAGESTYRRRGDVAGAGSAASVDVVVVSYNSRRHLRQCVSQYVDLDNVHAFVVDNASTDDSLECISDLPVVSLPQTENRGFGSGCNVGWRAGSSDYVLFLNPDARLDPGSLALLVGALEQGKGLGAVAPRIVDDEGSVDYSLRRFPTTRSTLAQALFVHRLWPRAGWVDETIRDPGAYTRRGAAEWVSGACILMRRSVLERVEGFDEEFFHYGEDKDLCRRVGEIGLAIGFEPAAIASHVGGASASRASLLPELARSRLRYSRKHMTWLGITAERFGIALGALSHAAFGKGGWDCRRGHVLAFLVALGFDNAGRRGSARSARGQSALEATADSGPGE